MAVNEAYVADVGSSTLGNARFEGCDGLVRFQQRLAIDALHDLLVPIRSRNRMKVHEQRERLNVPLVLRASVRDFV